jgi:hypothetical protein
MKLSKKHFEAIAEMIHRNVGECVCVTHPSPGNATPKQGLINDMAQFLADSNSEFDAAKFISMATYGKHWGGK